MHRLPRNQNEHDGRQNPVAKQTYDQIYQNQRPNQNWEIKGFNGLTKILDNYGHSNHGAEFTAEIIACDEMLKAEGLPGCSVLDVGCGWNEFAKALKAKNVDALGVDCSCPGADITCDIEHEPLPYPDKFFEMVTAFDVLEHLSADNLNKAVKEMARVSKRFIFTIGTSRSSINYGSTNLHEIQNPISWWQGYLSVYSVCHTINNRSITGKWR